MSALKQVAASLHSDLVGGLLLIGATVMALAWANSPLSPSYEAVNSFRFGLAALHLDLQLRTWAAEGLLAVFFFIVGNELKQEIVHGELRDPRRALLPVAAALGGAAVPALVFLAVNAPSSRVMVGGWGIPMASDPAFAVAVLAVVGRHLPAPLRTFLLTLATVDDMCAVLVLAAAYTTGLNLVALGCAAAGLLLFGYLQNGSGRAVTRARQAVPGWLLSGPLAVVVWALMHASGVHATIAGVALGLLMRTRTRGAETLSPSHRAEKILRPFSAAVAVPVFALMTAGVSWSGAKGFWQSTITWGVLGGMLVGKFLGVFGGSWLTARFTSARLNPLLAWPDIAGVGVLAGIGFTVCLLFAELSYDDVAYLSQAKGAVLLSSASAALLAALILGRRSTHRRCMRERHGAG
ncbi:Na+/H+ antiporter NhaA [Streptomyces sp. NPDC004680]|uniref:Na+/H+ antiporter NhaA n=1 Tax=Streptomyces sp. NPDC004680 TaxID=3154287 RepID=UPI0033B038E4